mmetsp:Transcript_19815/g.54526  ORF Transcript_19815/g.54526 Transcript_19815/m.54526 type:complete len:210 (+) Transcript_19815:150-779(+)
MFSAPPRARPPPPPPRRRPAATRDCCCPRRRSHRPRPCGHRHPRPAVSASRSFAPATLCRRPPPPPQPRRHRPAPPLLPPAPPRGPPRVPPPPLPSRWGLRHAQVHRVLSQGQGHAPRRALPAAPAATCGWRPRRLGACTPPRLRRAPGVGRRSAAGPPCCRGTAAGRPARPRRPPRRERNCAAEPRRRERCQPGPKATMDIEGSCPGL